jgi:hypothetical protein
VQPRLLILLLALLCGTAASAQHLLQGTVFDSSRSYTVESVMVYTSAGRTAITQKEGTYKVEVSDRDSVWFVFLGKPTMKYPVKTIRDLEHFDISLRVSARGNNYRLLQEVIVRGRNYRLDSLQNRKDYAKVFNFHRPNLSSMTSMGPGGAGIDVNELIRLFQFRRNRSMAHFQARIQQQEIDRFIDYRFNKALIRRLTALEGADLDAFAERFRPSLEFTEGSSDYDFQAYIKLCFEAWRTGKIPAAPQQ